MTFLEKVVVFNDLTKEKENLTRQKKYISAIDITGTITTSHLRLNVEDDESLNFNFNEDLTDDIVCLLFEKISKIRKRLVEIEQEIKQLEEV